MYVPAAFTADDQTVRRLLDEHGTADLVTATERGLLATTLPVVHDPGRGTRGALLG